MSKTMLGIESTLATAADVANAAPEAAVVLTGEQGGEGACGSSQPPPGACEEKIRTLAHDKWEAAGRPTGDGVEFWLEAEREINAAIALEESARQ